MAEGPSAGTFAWVASKTTDGEWLRAQVTAEADGMVTLVTLDTNEAHEVKADALMLTPLRPSAVVVVGNARHVGCQASIPWASHASPLLEAAHRAALAAEALRAPTVPMITPLTEYRLKAAARGMQPVRSCSSRPAELPHATDRAELAFHPGVRAPPSLRTPPTPPPPVLRTTGTRSQEAGEAPARLAGGGEARA